MPSSQRYTIGQSVAMYELSINSTTSAPASTTSPISTQHAKKTNFFPSYSLTHLVLQLTQHGPVRTLPAAKRIRLLLNGAMIADTTAALYVWEHEYYPQYYLPMESFVKPKGFDVALTHGEAIKNPKGRIVAGELELAVRRKGADEDYRVVREMVLFAEDLEGPARMLRNYVKVVFGVIDQWFEEDTPIYVHPRDPFKRIDTLLSTRPIRISLDGHILAESSYSVHLHEPLLPVRYYMPLTAVRTIYLRPSTTTTECPYKGVANYHHVVVNGKKYEDLVWWYRATTREAGMIEGLRCFYAEKVDVDVKNEDGDGGGWRRLDRPKIDTD